MFDVYSPVVQWSRIQGFGPCDPGSNPGRAIYYIQKNILITYIIKNIINKVKEWKDTSHLNPKKVLRIK